VTGEGAGKEAGKEAGEETGRREENPTYFDLCPWILI
jgi:hypothetical protein